MQSYELVGGNRAGFSFKGGSKDVFLSPKHFFQKDFDCFKLLQIW